MGWRRDWPERPKRPKVRKLSKKEQSSIIKSINNSIESSPVLSALNYRVRTLRGRFYYERVYGEGNTEEIETIARVTPIDAPDENDLLLEVGYGQNWSSVKTGTVRKIINAVSGDKKGTFHGLALLDKSIRMAKKKKLDRLVIVREEPLGFHYKDSDTKCSVQEVLFHYFKIPIAIISEPSEWYAYHRTPSIKEVSEDNEKLLVSFMTSSVYGNSFGGTCLYIKRGEDWNVYRIKPNQSDTIELAMVWIKMRKWRDWQR